MSAQSGGAAAQNGVECLPALPVETHPGAIEEYRPGGADDVGHLQRRPLHGVLFSLAAVQSKRVKGAGGGLQMAMRKMQVNRGRLQIAMPQQ